jgi:GT2 family glycosyltransferase
MSCPKVSIVILNWNTLEYLKKCVNSIKENTDNYELIIVDNGSKEDGTEDYISSVADRYIFNETNLGFSKGNNQGAELAKGEFICFCNSDIEVGVGWLDEMLITFNRDKKCGAVGTLGNPTDGFVGKTRVGFHQFKGQLRFDTIVNNLMAFCLLMKRDLFNEIKWNEKFILGGFEDNYLSNQIIKKEYNLWISVKADVTHEHPGRSYEANGLDYNDLLEKNTRIFYEKI